MKLLSKFALINVLGLSTLPALAVDNLMFHQNAQQTANNTQNISQYLLYLGGYLGYDLTKSPSANNKTVSQSLLQSSALPMQIMQMYAVSTFLGAVPVNAIGVLGNFLPPSGGVPNASTWNAFANTTFGTSGQNYSYPSSQQQGTVTVNALIDQQTFQPDPVSQTLLNILGTPDMSYCMSNDGTKWLGCSNPTTGGTLLPGFAVSAGVIGPIPSTSQYFTYQYNQQFISQLNSNTLTAPLMYDTSTTNQGGTSSPGMLQNRGLTAQSQAQQAANFIRYVSGSVTPIAMPNMQAYDRLFVQATTSPGTIPQIQAQASLANYFTSLRTYAAQFSVGVGNLYFIMSKRLPQNQSGSSSGGQSQSSQALSEFNMATWRLYNPDMSANNQWLNQLNTASPATVQKEIATLLAEINYQMYLNRQMEERILLTNSIMLLQNTRQTQPSANIGTTPLTESSQ